MRPAKDEKDLTSSVLDVIEQTRGCLNFDEALLVALQRDGAIGDVASFDSGFDLVE